jgi:hypothetical protein
MGEEASKHLHLAYCSCVMSCHDWARLSVLRLRLRLRLMFESNR